MTVEQLRARVLDVVQDRSLAGSVLGLLNQGLREIAGRILLPELDATGTVITDPAQPMVALPTDYHRQLYWVGSAAKEGRVKPLPVYDSFTTFLRHFPDPALAEGGGIVAVAVKGRQLYYQPSPTLADTLTLHYYRLPTLLSAEDDQPEGLPAHLEQPLLVHYVSRELFAIIEDGIEGAMTNTLYHEAQYQRYLGDLRLFCGEHHEPVYIADEEDSIYS